MKQTVSYTYRFLIVLSIVMTFAVFMTIVVTDIYFASWLGSVSDQCISNNPCKKGILYPNQGCKFFTSPNGTYCTPYDVCYNSSSQSFCDGDGLCVGQPQYCKGFCNVDADCPELPWSPRLDDNPLGECIEHSCVYTIVGSITAECLTWLDNPPDNPLVKQGCMVYRFTDMAFDYPPGICLIRYQCAPFDFLTPKMQQQAKKKKHSLEDHEVMDYFVRNKLDFHDLPKNPMAMTQLKIKIHELITRKINEVNGTGYYNATRIKSAKRFKAKTII